MIIDAHYPNTQSWLDRSARWLNPSEYPLHAQVLDWDPEGLDDVDELVQWWQQQGSLDPLPSNGPLQQIWGSISGYGDLFNYDGDGSCGQGTLACTR